MWGGAVIPKALSYKNRVFYSLAFPSRVWIGSLSLIAARGRGLIFSTEKKTKLWTGVNLSGGFPSRALRLVPALYWKSLVFSFSMFTFAVWMLRKLWTCIAIVQVSVQIGSGFCEIIMTMSIVELGFVEFVLDALDHEHFCLGI